MSACLTMRGDRLAGPLSTKDARGNSYLYHLDARRRGDGRLSVRITARCSNPAETLGNAACPLDLAGLAMPEDRLEQEMEPGVALLGTLRPAGRGTKPNWTGAVHAYFVSEGRPEAKPSSRRALRLMLEPDL